MEVIGRTGSEIIKAMEEEDREWATRVFIADGCLVLRMTPRTEGYRIELDRIDTPEMLLAWIAHLLEKTWCTREVLFRMVTLWEDHFHLNVHDLKSVGFGRKAPHA
jgi:hypothetical protein